MIKYHNAKDADGNIVSIDKAVKGKHYSCISCGKDMIPKQGKIREHHFSHKKERENSPENICNEETYLHEYAKHYIKRLFDTSTELMIVYNQYNVCHHFTSCLYYRKVLDNSSDEYSSSLCKGTTLGKFDLKRYYDTCELEKEYKGYVADVLLTSKEHPERDPLFVEIAVSHSCEPEKIDSGIHIIEIHLPRDTDNLNGLRIVEGKQMIQSSEEPVEILFYNFKRNQEKEETLNLFDINVYYTDIYNEDTSILCRNRCSCFGRESLVKSAAYEIHFPASYSNYSKWCLVQNEDLTNVRTCWLCKYHSYDSTKHEQSCDMGRTIEQPTLAFHCLKYEFDKTKASLLKEKLEKMFCRSFSIRDKHTSDTL